MERNILFLCTGNSARSQMCAAFLKKYAGDTFKAFSAGLEPKTEVFPPVVKVMKEIGIDLSEEKPKGIDQFLGRVHFEKVVIVCADADEKCPVIFGQAKREFWPFEDPASMTGDAAEIIEGCRQVRDQIDKRIREWLKSEGVSCS